MTAAPLGGADQLSRPRRAVFDQIATLPQRVMQGDSRTWGLGAPADHEPGEVLLDTMPNAARRRMALGSGPAAVQARVFLDNPKPARTEGSLYITDRRAVLMGNRRKVLGEWKFENMDRVEVMQGFCGIQFIEADSQADADCVLHFVNTFVVRGLRSPIETAWRHMLTTEAAYVLSGSKDWSSWLSLVPARLGA